MSGYIWANMWQYIGRPETRLGCRSRQASKQRAHTNRWSVVLCSRQRFCCDYDDGDRTQQSTAPHRSRTKTAMKRQAVSTATKGKKYLKFVFISFARTYFEFDSKSIFCCCFASLIDFAHTIDSSQQRPVRVVLPSRSLYSQCLYTTLGFFNK